MAYFDRIRGRWCVAGSRIANFATRHEAEEAEEQYLFINACVQQGMSEDEAFREWIRERMRRRERQYSHPRFKR